MLKRYGKNADRESEPRADEFATEGISDAASIWCRITDAAELIANTTPSGPVY